MHLYYLFRQALHFHRGVTAHPTLPADTSFIHSVPTFLQSASASSSPHFALNSMLPFSAKFTQHTPTHYHSNLQLYMQQNPTTFFDSIRHTFAKDGRG